MGFSPETSELNRRRREQRAKRILQTGWRRVQIVGWRWDPSGTRGNVIFEVHDAKGRAQLMKFSLSTPRIREGWLYEFVAAVKRWPVEEYRAQTFAVARASVFNQLVGQSLAVNIDRDSKRRYVVTGWSAAPLPAAPEENDAARGEADVSQRQAATHDETPGGAAARANQPSL